MIKKEFSKRKTIKDEILGLSEGEIIPLIRDLFGRSFFNNYEHKERATLLASVILNMSYKELEGKIEFLPLETNQDKAIYNKAICDIVLDIRLPNNPIILIIELNHFSKDLEILANDEKLLKQLKIKPNEIKTRILMKSFYYLNRIYGNQKIRNLEYAKTKKVIAYNLSTFGISEDSYDDIFRFSMSDLKHKIELTDKVEFYNLDVVNMSRTWYNEKYQERNKKERNLILLSNLLITDKLSIAECCIDKFELDMDIKEREKMKGDLKGMYSKDESELLESDLVENEDDFYYQSYLAMKKELLDYTKSEAFTEAVANAEEEALAKGREETKKDTIINSYKENIPVEIIARICKTSLAKVNKIIKEYCL